MNPERFTSQHCTVGIAAAGSLFLLGLVYALTTLLGLLSLRSPADPIGAPFFSIMELLILIMALLMVIIMGVVHAYASAKARIFSLTALICMILMAGITSGVHFVILTTGRHLESTNAAWHSVLLAFKWPSLAYALDLLAWDWFFALAMLFAVPAIRGNGRLEATVRILMIVSGVLSLAGLIGVPLQNMQVRNIGIIGYGLIAPVVFLLLGFVFYRFLRYQDSREL